MAIPQGRLSTTTVYGNYLPPRGVRTHPVASYELGPLAIEDTTEGLQYQDWLVTWDPNTDFFTATPQTTGPPAPDLLSASNVSFASFTFDQSARITYTYVNNVSSYLVWYDTQVGQYVTTDLGVDVLYPVIYLDDKRYRQNVVNDMLLWYTKLNGSVFDLFMRVQRDRFTIETEMETSLAASRIVALGMATGLRLQLGLRD